MLAGTEQNTKYNTSQKKHSTEGRATAGDRATISHVGDTNSRSVRWDRLTPPPTIAKKKKKKSVRFTRIYQSDQPVQTNIHMEKQSKYY